MTETRETRTTERRASTGQAGTDARTLADVDHTHPVTGRTFGGNFTFARGGVIAADGGRPDVVPDGDGDEDARETLRDVDHTPPNDSENANRVFERGDEARDEDDDEAPDAGGAGAAETDAATARTAETDAVEDGSEDE